METKCTWKDCDGIAKHVQKDNNGKPWAVLCSKHHNEIEETVKKQDVRGILRCWIKAQGGAKVASDRVLQQGPNIADIIEEIDKIGKRGL